MGLTLDESTENDTKVDFEGFSVVAEQRVIDEISGVNIDYRDSPGGSGFVIRPGNFDNSGCGGCSCG